MGKKKTGATSSKPVMICLGGLLIAIFALAGNVPWLSSIQLIPGVPVTLQIFLIAIMGLIMGTKNGLIVFASLLLLTLCGVPTMSGGRGGPSVFVGPTSGYIYGWAFIIILLGLYSDYILPKIISKKLIGISMHFPVSFVIGMAGVIIDYVFGSISVVISAGTGMASFLPVFISSFQYVVADMIKIFGASVVSYAFFASRVFKRIKSQI